MQEGIFISIEYGIRKYFKEISSCKSCFCPYSIFAFFLNDFFTFYHYGRLIFYFRQLFGHGLCHQAGRGFVGVDGAVVILRRFDYLVNAFIVFVEMVDASLIGHPQPHEERAGEASGKPGQVKYRKLAVAQQRTPRKLKVIFNHNADVDEIASKPVPVINRIKINKLVLLHFGTVFVFDTHCSHLIALRSK